MSPSLGNHFIELFDTLKALQIKISGRIAFAAGNSGLEFSEDASRDSKLGSLSES
jgi:hypothetical protein